MVYKEDTGREGVHPKLVVTRLKGQMRPQQPQFFLRVPHPTSISCFLGCYPQARAGGAEAVLRFTQHFASGACLIFINSII